MYTIMHLFIFWVKGMLIWVVMTKRVVINKKVLLSYIDSLVNIKAAFYYLISINHKTPFVNENLDLHQQVNWYKTIDVTFNQKIHILEIYNYLDTPCQLLPSTSNKDSFKKATISSAPWKTMSSLDLMPKEDLNNSEPESSKEIRKPQSFGTNPLISESQETHGELHFWKSSSWMRMLPQMTSVPLVKSTLNIADSSYNQTSPFHTTSDFMEIRTQKLLVNLPSQAPSTD